MKIIRMTPALLLLPALLLPAAPAGAQLLNQGPAANTQAPESRVPNPTQGGGGAVELRRSGPEQGSGAPSSPRGAADSGGSPGDSPPSTRRSPQDGEAPRAPAVPGATRPESSTGIFNFGDSPVPARPGARPDASTTAPPDRR
jgi:hypothetical protein